MMNSKILTAIEIDGNDKTIESELQNRIDNFLKQKLKKIVREKREELKALYPNDAEKQIIKKEESDSILEKLRNDNDTNLFKEHTRKQIITERNNYYAMRDVLNNLNDLCEFSAEIERMDLQKIDYFDTYEEYLHKCLSNADKFSKIIEIRKSNIQKYIDNKRKISTNESEISSLITLRDFYKITKDCDEIELYEKYEFLSNIEYSNRISHVLLHEKTNIINEFYHKKHFSSFVNTQIISNELFSLLLLNDKNNAFVSNNTITCLNTMYTNNTTNDKIFTTRTIGELLYEITNEDLKHLDKAERQQIYSSFSGLRPSSEDYHTWSGLQVFDIDLKKWTGNIEQLKNDIFKILEKFHWLLWVCRSASGKGIHIYTKVTPPHHVFTEASENENLLKYFFRINYETKLSLVHETLLFLHNNETHDFSGNILENFENQFIDNSVGRITSGIRLTYDAKPLVNNSFLDLPICVDLHKTLQDDEKSNMNRVLLRETETALKYRIQIDELAKVKLGEVKKEEKIDLAKFAISNTDLDEVKALPKESLKYVVRYNVCNTLAALFGKDGLSIAHILLDSKNSKNVNEINAFYSCAISNKKQATKLGLDILKNHGIIKNIDSNLKEKVDKTFKDELQFAIEKVLHNVDIVNKIDLRNGYLSDIKRNLLDSKNGGFTHEKINILLSPPNTGKTSIIKELAQKDKKRILLVLPFISVISNKIEKDSEITSIFECFYGTKDINELERGINAVTTFDKFSKANFEKISRMFDYIFIDESHLLFTSAYRIEATSNAIRNIKDLFAISQIDPFAAKIVLMTGTETGESYFFSSMANMIRVTKILQQKSLEFVICDDLLDATTRMATKISSLLQENYRILVPTNKGEIYSEKIIGMVQHLLNRKVKYGYYKRSNTEQDICQMINEKNTIGEYEIVFCSNYLSVGIDINDDYDFAALYLGSFTGAEIDQFNSRIRKKSIRSFYFVKTEKNDGTIEDVLLDEPNLVLHITEDEKNIFCDDKEIASAKQEVITQYDPVLQKISTPGFSYLNGKIKFNLEEYELITFENKYNECMQHPVKVARELDCYGYNISVCTEFEGLELAKQTELKTIGIQAAKEEKMRKHNLLVGTFLDIINKNSYTNRHGLEYNNIVEWLIKNPDRIIEDRELENHYIKLKFDAFATPLTCTVKSKEAFDAMIKSARYLLGKYTPDKITLILNSYVDENGILKITNFKRAINLLKLVDSSDSNELSQPLVLLMDKLYAFVDTFEESKTLTISHNSYKAMLNEWTNNYIDALGIRINTTYAFEKIQDSILELLLDIAAKTNSKAGVRFDYNKLPETNSNTVLNRRAIDIVIEKLFKTTTDVMKSNEVIKQKRKNKAKHFINEQSDVEF